MFKIPGIGWCCWWVRVGEREVELYFKFIKTSIKTVCHSIQLPSIITACISKSIFNPALAISLAIAPCYQKKTLSPK